MAYNEQYNIVLFHKHYIVVHSRLRKKKIETCQRRLVSFTSINTPKDAVVNRKDLLLLQDLFSILNPIKVGKDS